MDLSKIPVGVNPPYDVNAIIEIPQGGEPVKYEIDKDSARSSSTVSCTPLCSIQGNYGFIPHTLGRRRRPDGHHGRGPDPRGARARSSARGPIGTLMMTDEAGGDEKVLAVPVDALHPFYTGVDSWRSLPGILTEQIAHFFQHYKDLEKGKSVKITGWADPEQTADLIRASIERYKAAG
jgi:inorganic pyrophosphatase